MNIVLSPAITTPNNLSDMHTQIMNQYKGPICINNTFIKTYVFRLDTDRYRIYYLPKRSIINPLRVFILYFLRQKVEL